ncbi:MAG: hypothetical protein EU535_05560 [Promethearchaeota archaeon]|nr:MAG: hypothetical protein EU535_05560 [Candidatus Lokiarchaeota archaeon]
MPEFEILEFIALLIIICPFSFAYYIIKRRKDMFPLLPGATFLVLSFLCTNLEAFAAPDAFNFMEHLFIMLAGISFLVAMIFMHYIKISKKPVILSKSPKKEGW